MKVGRSFYVGLLICILAGSAYAQGLTSVRGVVTDTTGAVIPGVEVTVTNSATGLSRSAITNDTGTYSVTQLPPGTYSIRAELAGFKAAVGNNVPLPVNELVTFNLKLEVGTITDVVDVVAAADVVNTTNAQLGVSFDSKKIVDLPLNARNIVGLLSLQAGVTVSEKVGGEFGRDDGGQVNGARNDQQNIVLDGVNVNRQEAGSSLEGALPTTLDSVQEFIVQTAGQTGGASRGSGGQVQLVTKSGSNVWHGSAYESYRTTGTSARNYFANEPSVLIRHQPGGTLGGPIRKDKLFIFGAYERNTDRSATLESRVVPTPEFLNGQIRYQRKDKSFGALTDGSGGGLERWTGIPGDRWNPAMIGATGFFEKYRPFSTDAARTRPGADNGANLLIYRFNAPFVRNRNIYISRIDYNLNSKNTLYARGTLNDDVRTLSAERFPGLKNSRDRIDNSKGFAANWNSVLTNRLNSNFSAGLTRESFENTGAVAPVYNSPFANPAQTTGAERQAINTWNFVENLSWLKGNHTVETGMNYRFVDNKLISFDVVRLPSYSHAANLTGGGIGAAQSPGLRRALGDAEFANVADPGIVGDSVLAALGAVTQFSEGTQFGINGNQLPGGTAFRRNYGIQEYDFYLQDSWKMKSNLTLSYGIHYSVQTPPYERDGVQVNWVENLGQRWRTQRDSAKDLSQYQLMTTQLSGRANKLPDFYSTDLNNWAPRVSAAWTPGGDLLSFLTKKGGQMVIRGGYSLTYDSVGRRFARDAATQGSIGLVQSVNVSSFAYSIDGVDGVPRAPRIGPGLALPRSTFPSASGQSFSLAHTGGGPGAISTTGIDNGLHSPTNHLLNVTVTKELPGGWVLEGSYVGRFARDLVGQVDLATAPNLRDPKSGQTYYQAFNELMTKYETQRVPVSGVQPIAWFENVYPEMKGYVEGLSAFRGTTFASATQAWYAYINRGKTIGPNSPLSVYDQWGELEQGLKKVKMMNPQSQFWGLFGNFGRSNYNSGQFSIRRRFSQGVTLAANYTLSKSMDITSAAEARGSRANGTTGEGLSADPYNPDLSYAVSDFDRRHQFNGNFGIDLPFGKGQWIGRNVPTAVNQIIGGWQISGIVIATSGRPFNYTASNRFNFHWFGRDQPRLIKPIDYELTKQSGRVFMIPGSFDDRIAITQNNFANSVPGMGFVARNQGLGPNFKNIDLSVGKTFSIRENMNAKLRWETFNLFNHPNFGIPSTESGHNIDRGGGGLGETTTTVGNERVMQFSFRLQF